MVGYVNPLRKVITHSKFHMIDGFQLREALAEVSSVTIQGYKKYCSTSKK